MKVLHVIPAIADIYGGPSAAIRALVAAQSRIPDLQATVVATDAAASAETVSVLDSEFACPLLLFRRTFSERWKYSHRLANWLRHNVRQFDVVHVHALWSYSTFAASRAAMRAGVPYILRPAGMLSEYSLNHRRLYKRVYSRVIEHQTLAGAAGFHATTAGEAMDILKVLPTANVQVIANGVDERTWSIESEPSELKRVLGISDSHPIVLFLSRLHPKKGITDLLLPAFEELDAPARLVIAGGTDGHAPEYAARVASQIASMRKRRFVHLVGNVPPSGRWTYFDGADLFVLPSHAENFGIVVAESMARSCPVLITDRVQIENHVRAAMCGEVVSLDVTELSAAIERMLGNSELRKRMGAAGTSYAHLHFSWSQIASQLQNFYHSVVGKPPGAEAAKTYGTFNPQCESKST